MNIFRKMLRTLSLCYNPFRKNKTEAKETTSEKGVFVSDKYAIILSRDHNNKTKLDVVYNIDLNNSDSIIKNAENLAEMIVYLTSNSFQKTIISELSDKYNHTETVTDKIFIDNIIAFHDVIKQEVASANKSKLPVIRPLSVFSAK